ncbi:spore coat protein GerQ [Paenibacillus sp. FSL W7-1287]|uniref:spore coat protein GerQ n=2 Tax=Paenibacillus TaxID=44249 RepID=UPI00203CEDB6|nr:spore coat protein GerQ [Paenibacillus camelliae]MCM3635132.1 spore coat protein GerQ [Paenibacillus camelliae]
MSYFDQSYYYPQNYAPFYRDAMAAPQYVPTSAMTPAQFVPTSAMTPPPSVPSGAMVTPMGETVVTQQPQFEESYVENILRLNRGKVGTFYMTYENNSQWNAKIFVGIIEAAGRDHIIISDPRTGQRHLLLMLNLDYVTFDEPINYEYPFHGQIVTPETPPL